MKDIDEVLKEYSAFKNRICKYTVFIAVLFELISLPIFGLSLKFLYGLALGTSVAIVNFYFHAWTCKKLVYGGKGLGISILGYFIRLLIYGACFYGCAKIDIIHCGFGCIAGFLTIKAAILYLHAFKAWFAEKRKKAQALAEEKREQSENESEEEE